MSLSLKVLSAPWGRMGGVNPHLQQETKNKTKKKPCRATQRIRSDICALSQWEMSVGYGIYTVYERYMIIQEAVKSERMAMHTVMELELEII